VLSSTATIGCEAFVLHSGRLPVYVYADDSRSMVGAAHSLSQASVVTILDEQPAVIQKGKQKKEYREERQNRILFVPWMGNLCCWSEKLRASLRRFDNIRPFYLELSYRATCSIRG
jgi:hypothetical protein